MQCYYPTYINRRRASPDLLLFENASNTMTYNLPLFVIGRRPVVMHQKENKQMLMTKDANK